MSVETPRSVKSMPEPATRSRIVAVTRISLGSAAARTLAAVWTAIPPTFRPLGSTSPKWRPARISSPSGRSASMMAMAHTIACAGRSNIAKKPSPAVSISLPRNCFSCARTTRWWRATRSRQARSPMLAARSVEPTISVNMTVARTRSWVGVRRMPRSVAHRAARNYTRAGFSAGAGVRLCRLRRGFERPHEVHESSTGIGLVAGLASTTRDPTRQDLRRWRPAGRSRARRPARSGG